jgi:hypothetical protein
VAAGAALVGAGPILVMFVLPAEFAVDPLGTGATFGLLPLGVVGQQVDELNKTAAAAGGAGQAAIIIEQEKPFQQESVDVKLKPGEGMEYKYRLDKGERSSTRRMRPRLSTTSCTPNQTARPRATRKATRSRRPTVRQAR